MTDAPRSRKVCVLCGQDCSNRPRVRNARGRYYCKSCYEQAASQRAAMTPVPARPKQTGGLDLLGEIVDQLAQPASPTAPARSCPACGGALDADAVICTNCGHNSKTGRSNATEVAAPVVVTSDDGSAHGRVWPILIGSLSILLSCAALVVSLWVVGIVVSQDPGELARAAGVQPPETSAQMVDPTGIKFAYVLLIAFFLLTAALALYLLWNSVSLACRRQRCVPHLRMWSIITTVLFGTCVLSSLALAVAGDALGRTVSGSPFAQVSGRLGFLFLVSAGFPVWPIFLLLWLRRDSIQAQLGDWRSPPSA